MNSKFFKKLAIFLGLAFGAVTVASCQTVDPNDAVVQIDQPLAKVYTEEGTTTKYATATIGVVNNSIYDVYSWDFSCDVTKGETTSQVNWEQYMYVTHGAAGYVTLLQQVDSDVTQVKINSVTRAQYRDVFSTYLFWWIAAIVIAAVSIITFTFFVFTNHLTSEQTKAAFKERSSSLLWIFSFTLLLCLFPLCFGNWVPTVILSGAVFGSLLVEGVITYIKAALTKNKQ